MIALVIGFIAIAFPREIGLTYAVGSDNLPLASGYQATPTTIVEDASQTASGVFGTHQQDCQGFIDQVLALYSAAKDKDFLIIFNPGGWGSSPLQTDEGWWTILVGIKSHLDRSGYTTLLSYHLRTNNNPSGYLNELRQRITGYGAKARELTAKVEFLIRHIPQLRIILTGESTGVVISDRVVELMADNPHVYSIQTGPPFWHRVQDVPEQTLVMTDNGITTDTYSHGNLPAIILGNLKYRLGLTQPIDDYGTPPHHIGAPGHDYWWQYPEVALQITDFLDEMFEKR